VDGLSRREVIVRQDQTTRGWLISPSLSLLQDESESAVRIVSYVEPKCRRAIPVDCEHVVDSDLGWLMQWRSTW
jgi:hypothetical protein